MVESTTTQEAYFLRSAVHQHHEAIGIPGAGPEALQDAITARDRSLVRLLELRKAGPLPFTMDVTLDSDPLVEEIHPFSRTSIKFNLPKEANPEAVYSIRMNLASLGGAMGINDSTKTLEQIGDFNWSGVRRGKFLMRSVREIQSIEDAQALVPVGTDDPKRRELRELRDKLIIDRFLFALKNNRVPVRSELTVKRMGGLILLTFRDDREGSFPLPIEIPTPGKYSDERNSKLQELLEQLDLAA